MPSEPILVRIGDGTAIDTRYWGPEGAPSLVFVHGNGGHIGWWSFLAPFFADRYRVAAFSLSGMGGSDWRDRYTMPRFADEIRAVAGTAQAGPQPPILVAHSMGGFPAILAGASDWPVRALILVDVALPGVQPIEVKPYSGHHIYESREAALARFRLAPAQPCENDFLLRHLGEMAIKPIEGGGWTWRFDPDLWSRIDFGGAWEALPHVRCPVALVRGALSPLTGPKMIAAIREALPCEAPLISIPFAHHHVMVDQPIALVAALDSLLEAWIPIA
ncbi:alpha/beta fold hydrolase [Flavisphingomonas formosensis]|uniref:alpha/beta fold hydrolase n=1 Tax=Flavisphingomonas formosensis TaxID=861534 RepID=UPI0012F93144|nr:alpha/beta hydrolase [Sphingomonas formosensis]